MLDALARFAYRRSRIVALATVVFFLAAGAVGGSAFDVLKPFGFEDPEAESIVSREALGEAAGVEPAPSLVALVEPGGGVRSEAGRAQVAEVARIMRSDPAIGSAASPFDSGNGGGRAMVSEDGRAAYVLGFFAHGLGDEGEDEAAARLAEALSGKALLGGFGSASNQIGSTVEKDLQRAELLAFPILFLLAFWVFRSLVAAALPLLVGAIAIVGALAGLRLGGEVTDLSIFAVNVVTAMGLGLSIDYALFVVSRYREELAKRDAFSGRATRIARWEALRTTMNTAGRTVVFSAVTVATAMGALVIFPQRFLYSMGLGGALVALFAGFVAITVLPAVLALLGPRVNALAPKRLQRAAADAARPAAAGFWYRLSRAVQRRPIAIATVTAAVMVLAGVPFLRSEFVFADAGILPPETSARQVDDALKDRFDRSRTTPIVVEARTADRAEARDLARRVAALEGVAEVGRPVPVGAGLTRLDVFSRAPQFADESQDVVREIRALPGPPEVRVGGATAEFVDQRTSLGDHLPTAVAIIALTTLVALFVMTGSLILPLKSLVMNLLTVSVAFGALVLVFQDGRLEGLLDYRSLGALDQSNAIFLFAVIFGLSTDYGVFLLSRIKEARDSGLDDSEAVAVGLERTGRLVSAAALLLGVALGAFATSSIIFIKQFALGAVVGIAVDATLVRALLVPSLMQLLGRWNWWAPRPLRRLHARLGLSET